MSKTLVIAGTDTGVGKTFVGAALARSLSMSGRYVVAMKLIESGCAGHEPSEEDGRILASATGQSEPLEALVRLEAAVTPAMAADLEGVELDFATLLERARDLAAGADVTIVEGVGGLLAPLTWRHNTRDLARELEASVILVASDRLGTINHTLLTLGGLASTRVDALVLSAPEVPDASTGTNAEAIRMHAGALGIAVPPIVVLERIESLDEAAAELGDLAAALVGGVWV